MEIYTPQLVCPEKGNPYYNTKSNGGYSNAIVGSPTCDGLNVLSNCVGYAVGRFSSIENDTTMSALKPVNAKDFIKYKRKDLVVGTEPKLGACAVWSGGNSGYGHVAIVEAIRADGSIVTSESGYGYLPPFYIKTRKNDGRWGQNSKYTFLGFIYQTKEYEAMPTTNEITFPVTAVKKGSQGNMVKEVQTILKGLGYYSGIIDGSAGTKTVAAILTYQKQRGLYEDGSFGVKCWKSFLNLT